MAAYSNFYLGIHYLIVLVSREASLNRETAEDFDSGVVRQASTAEIHGWWEE